MAEGSGNGFFSTLCKPSVKYSLGALLVVGVVLGVVGWGGFNTMMEATNTEAFCISCHEMKDNVYEEYKKTIHYNNRTGVRATCPDCHVPKEWVHKFARKIQASNELLHHFLGTIDTREKFEGTRSQLAVNVWKTMQATDSRECRNCHAFNYMDMTKQDRRAQRRHDQAVQEKKTCIECHKGVAHEMPADADEAMKKAGIK